MKIKRSIIKKKCKLFNKIINNIDDDDKLDDIILRINKEMKTYFGCNILDYISTESVTYDIIQKYQYFEVDKYICCVQINNPNLFIKFNRIVKIDRKNRESNFYLKSIKQLSLSNFIRKYLNKDGLIILERIMFDIL